MCSMPERPSYHETGNEDQDVNGREQKQRWTTEVRNRFVHEIIYIINE